MQLFSSFIPPFDLLNHNEPPFCLLQSVYVLIHLSLLVICMPPSLLSLLSECHQTEPHAEEISVRNVTLLPRGVVLYCIDPVVFLNSAFPYYTCACYSPRRYTCGMWSFLWTFCEHVGSQRFSSSVLNEHLYCMITMWLHIISGWYYKRL